LTGHRSPHVPGTAPSMTQTCASANLLWPERDVASGRTLRWDDTVHTHIIPSRQEMLMAGLDMRDLWWTRGELKSFKRELHGLMQDAAPPAPALTGVASSLSFSRLTAFLDIVNSLSNVRRMASGAAPRTAFRQPQPQSQSPTPEPRPKPRPGRWPRQHQAARHAYRAQPPHWRATSPRIGQCALGSKVTLVGPPRFKGRIGHIESAASRRGWCLVRLTDRSLHCLKLRPLTGARIGQSVACAPLLLKHLSAGIRPNTGMHLVLGTRLVPGAQL
jgi:hypothetical protein